MDVSSVVFAASSDGGSFGSLNRLSLQVQDISSDSMARFDVPSPTSETALLFGELYRRGGVWKFRAVGQGWDTGLAGLATHFGIIVDSDASADDVNPAAVGVSAIAVPEDSHSTTTTIGSGADGVASVEPVGVFLPDHRSDSTEGLAQSLRTIEVEGAPDLSLVNTGEVRVPRSRAKNGIQTRKVRQRPVAPARLALAGDDSWQPARLFSIVGVGVAEEQERRSTSADIRAGQVRVGFEVSAPTEGSSARKLSWLLRQLKDAPDSMLVEALFEGRPDSTCERLKDARANAGILVPDRGMTVKGFRLSIHSPLGTKRSGVRGAFIPSVTATVEQLYSTAVQPVRPWVAPAPKLPESDSSGDPAEV